MAEEKIQFTFFGKYLVGDSFKKLDSDTKKTQASLKGFSGLALKSLNTIAGAFDGELNVVMTKSLCILNEMARGGIWGVMGAAGHAACEVVASGFVKLIEKASECDDRIIDLIAHANDFKESLNRIADGAAIKRMKSALEEATNASRSVVPDAAVPVAMAAPEVRVRVTVMLRRVAPSASKQFSTIALAAASGRRAFQEVQSAKPSRPRAVFAESFPAPVPVKSTFATVAVPSPSRS